MRVCIRSPPRVQLHKPESHLQKAVEVYAEAALMAGQGNSGTALSNFFISLAAGLAEAGGKPKVPIAVFAEALEKTGTAIQSAFPPDKLKEGTIVSVIRKSTKLASAKHMTLKDLVTTWADQAKTALYETPDELEVDGVFILKEAAAKVPDIPLFTFRSFLLHIALLADPGVHTYPPDASSSVTPSHARSEHSQSD
jgi:dihydroxyacetone kinase-like predicted kinase